MEEKKGGRGGSKIEKRESKEKKIKRRMYNKEKK